MYNIKLNGQTVAWTNYKHEIDPETGQECMSIDYKDLEKEELKAKLHSAATDHYNNTNKISRLERLENKVRPLEKERYDAQRELCNVKMDLAAALNKIDREKSKFESAFEIKHGLHQDALEKILVQEELLKKKDQEIESWKESQTIFKNRAQQAEDRVFELEKKDKTAKGMQIVGIEKDQVYIKNSTGKILISPLSVMSTISCLKDTIQTMDNDDLLRAPEIETLKHKLNRANEEIEDLKSHLNSKCSRFVLHNDGSMEFENLGQEFSNQLEEMTDRWKRANKKIRDIQEVLNAVR